MNPDVISAAQSAQSCWALDDTLPELLSHRENAVFRVTQSNGSSAALRLHRPGYNSAAEILSELQWTEALAEMGFAVPRPIASKTGDLLVTLGDGQIATCLSWAEGGPLGEGGRALTGTIAEQRMMYKRVGKMLAALHNLSDRFEAPLSFTRRQWDVDGFLGPKPLWGKFWQNPALSVTEVGFLIKTRDLAQKMLCDYRDKGADFGLIHADALRENIFQHGQNLTLIDFDDAGYGFRLFDLTTALSQSLQDREHDDLLDALFEGYGAQRPIRQTDRDHVRLFSMLRAFASLGWIVPRAKPNDPRQRSNCDRALWAARRFLEG